MKRRARWRRTKVVVRSHAKTTPRQFASLPPASWRRSPVAPCRLGRKAARRRASPFLSREILQSDVVEHGVREHALEFGALVFQRPQAPGHEDFHAAGLRFPFVDARVADAVLPAELRDGDAVRKSSPCSFWIAMICSSLNRLRFMFWSFRCGQNELQTGLGQRGNVRRSASVAGSGRRCAHTESVAPKAASSACASVTSCRTCVCSAGMNRPRSAPPV